MSENLYPLCESYGLRGWRPIEEAPKNIDDGWLVSPGCPDFIIYGKWRNRHHLSTHWFPLIAPSQPDPHLQALEVCLKALEEVRACSDHISLTTGQIEQTWEAKKADAALTQVRKITGQEEKCS